MKEIVDNVKDELLKICKSYNEKYGYDFWNDHIKYVVQNSVNLAKKYNADIEIVELAALLHDISMPSEYGPRDEHHIYGAKIADELLTKFNYPEDRKERVKACILNHRGSKDLKRNSIEEQIVADADAIAHFDCIPSLFHLAFNKDSLDLSIEDGTKYVKKKLEKDYNKLSEKTKKEFKDRYENIMKSIFVENNVESESNSSLRDSLIKYTQYIGKKVDVIIDRPLGSSHPHYPESIYPLNYGYIPNTVSGDGKEIDCFILGEYKALKEFKGKCIAVIHRLDDNEDKLVVTSVDKDFTDSEIKVLTDFQEQYYHSIIIR